jgi:hypothetical protein
MRMQSGAVSQGLARSVAAFVITTGGPVADAQYLPPVSNAKLPPQTIISLPAHTAVWPARASGALVLLVVVQLSVLGLYLPPVFKPMNSSMPPHTIISLPVHTAVKESRAPGALEVLVAVQLFVSGLYLPPVFE